MAVWVAETSETAAGYFLRAVAAREPEAQAILREAAEVLAHLTDAGKRQFSAEFSAALVVDADDWQPVRRAVRAWYRTLVARRDSRYTTNMTADLSADPIHPAE